MNKFEPTEYLALNEPAIMQNYFVISLQESREATIQQSEYPHVFMSILAL